MCEVDEVATYLSYVPFPVASVFFMPSPWVGRWRESHVAKNHTSTRLDAEIEGESNISLFRRKERC